MNYPLVSGIALALAGISIRLASPQSKKVTIGLVLAGLVLLMSAYFAR
jgi:hypothetical protein